MYKLHHYRDVVAVAGYLLVLVVHYWVLSVGLEECFFPIGITPFEPQGAMLVEATLVCRG